MYGWAGLVGWQVRRFAWVVDGGIDIRGKGNGGSRSCTNIEMKIPIS